MGMDSRELLDLENRITECKRAQPDLKLTTVSVVTKEYECFSGAYHGKINKKQRHAFWNGIHELADKTRFSEQDAGRGLYVLNWVLFIGRGAQDDNVEDYCPVTHVFGIAHNLPQKMLTVSVEERDQLLNALVKKSTTFHARVAAEGITSMNHLAEIYRDVEMPDAPRQDVPPYWPHLRKH